MSDHTPLDAAPAPTDNQSWFREEYARAKERNDQTPQHARMIVTNPELSAHQPAPTDNQHDGLADRVRALADEWATRGREVHRPHILYAAAASRLRAVVDGPTTEGADRD